MTLDEKLQKFTEELARLLMKHKFVLWACDCCGAINVKDISGEIIADELNINFIDDVTIQYEYCDKNGDYKGGKYCESKTTN